MGKILRWIAVFAAITVLTAIFEPLVVSELQEWGWYDNPTDALGPVLNWLAEIVGDAAFPWIAAGVLGFSAGVWADWALRKWDKSRPTKEQQFFGLSTDLEFVRGQIVQFAQSIEPSQSKFPIPVELQANIHSLLISLDKAGIPTPERSAEYDYRVQIYDMNRYLTLLSRLSIKGHYREAKRDAKRMLETFNKLEITDEVPVPQSPQDTESEKQR